MARPGSGIPGLTCTRRRRVPAMLTAQPAPTWSPARMVPSQGTLSTGLFVLPERAKARCLWFSTEGFAGAHYGYGLPTVREICVGDSSVQVNDAVPKANGGVPRSRSVTTIASAAELAASAGPGVPFSPGYGLVERRDG